MCVIILIKMNYYERAKFFRTKKRLGQNFLTDGEVIQDIIDYAKIPVRAMLGRSSISVNDFANLQIGDVIKLDTKVDDELDVYVGNIRKFTALPGASSNSYAIRVTSIIREEQYYG